MPELFQRFSGMADAGQMQANNSNDRRLFAEDELRATQALTDVDWTDQAGADLVAATHQEFVQTAAAADHQAAQGRAYNQCAADGAGTLARCVGIASSL